MLYVFRAISNNIAELIHIIMQMCVKGKRCITKVLNCI